jgi:membrane-associated protease RseP (regulator of RpoE activity)
MLIVTIFLGLIGLGIVVIIHELGHFAAARAMGVEVEAFSVGWGPKIAGFQARRHRMALLGLPYRRILQDEGRGILSQGP